jgi:hypothetical protein
VLSQKAQPGAKGEEKDLLPAAGKEHWCYFQSFVPLKKGRWEFCLGSLYIFL